MECLMINISTKLNEYTALTVNWQKQAFLAQWVREYQETQHQQHPNEPINIMQAKQDVLATMAFLLIKKREHRHTSYRMTNHLENTIKEIIITLNSFGAEKFDKGHDHEPRIKGLHI